MLRNSSSTRSSPIGSSSIGTGIVRHTNGVLPMAALARTQGFKTLFVPASDAPEAALVPDRDVCRIETLFALVMHLQGTHPIAPYRPLDDFKPTDAPAYAVDFSEIRGQEHVKRALEAAAGQHNVFMLWTTSHTVQHRDPRFPQLESDSAGKTKDAPRGCTVGASFFGGDGNRI